MFVFTLESQACPGILRRLSSPDGHIEVRFCLSQGTPSYSIAINGQERITPSRLGFEIKNQPALKDGLALTSVKRRAFDDTWEQVWGEERFIRNQFREMTLFLVEKSALKRQLRLVFRAFNDGVGFRYEIPKQKALAQFEIIDELTEFNFARDHKAWWIDAYEEHDYEQLYKKSRISEFKSSFTPLTIEGGDLTFSIHEANLTNYSGMALVTRGPGRLKAALYPWADGTLVKTHSPMQTPWRTIQVARKPGDLITSYLILNLNEPSRVGDTSWIKPSKFIGIWWGMHIGKFSWNSGPLHGATTENAIRYIDAAKALNIPSLLIEGWNIGWDSNWYGHGGDFNFTKPMPDFDFEKVSSYAQSQGVSLIGHHETGADLMNYERQLESAYQFLEDHGIHHVKTGYVGPRLDEREWHQGQRMVEHQQMVYRMALEHKVALDIHEPIKDTGLRRTYPHIMSREGARGTEYDAWGDVLNPPEHTTILPFTRLLSGPMDFTPGIVDLLAGARANCRSQTTLAKQLAFYVVIYSPLQMAADLPENYFGHPALKFIQEVPTDWHTTRVLNGQIGNYITVARRDRTSNDWWLGSITDEKAREIEISLDFLEPGRSYRAEIYRDRAETHYMSNPKAFEIKSRLVGREDRLKLKLAPGGGQAIHFRAL